MAEEDASERLEVELRCPECGAAVVVGIWDQSARCAFCASLLACGRVLGEEVFVVTDATPTPLDVVALLIRSETESYRNELIGRSRNQEGLQLDLPTLLDARVALFRATLEAELEPVDDIDFLAPYELRECTVVQAMLGRRAVAKESFVQCFFTEDLRRRFDPSHTNLRDRGLKIRGAKLALLSDAHRDSVENRHLEAVDATPNRVAPPVDRSRTRVDGDAQVIAQVEGVLRERQIRLWKHLSVGRVRRAGVVEDYLIDHQFDTIAGRLSGDEAARLRALQPRALAGVLTKPSLRAVASECPNCGADLALPPRALIAFCATCALGVRVTPEGLLPCAYGLVERPVLAKADGFIGFPFWSVPFRLRAGGREWTRVWDWLEAVSPQPAATRFREQDPAESRIYIPARAIFGARDLDDAFAALTATTTWRQPLFRRERAAPADPLQILDVEIESSDAATLARFALVSLHDAQSTRSLNGMNFRTLIRDAQLAAGESELVVLPLAIHASHWVPCPPVADGDPAAAPVGMRPVPVALLEDPHSVPRVSRAFSLT